MKCVGNVFRIKDNDPLENDPTILASLLFLLEKMVKFSQGSITAQPLLGLSRDALLSSGPDLDWLTPGCSLTFPKATP